MPLRPLTTASLLFGVTILVYGYRLGAAPLTPAEAVFSSQAQSLHIGATPVFFHVQDEHWLQPTGVYANAAIRAVGGGEASGRVASVIAGAANVALVFLIAQLITGRNWPGFVAALVLMLTPAHRALAQLGTDAILPAPFVLLWLWQVLTFLARDTMRSLGLAAAALGASVYAQPAAPLTAIFLWMLTLAAARSRHRGRLVTASVIFAAAWIPAVVWFALHFNTYADIYGRWVIFAAHLRNPLDGVRAFMNPNTLGIRSSMYWGFWDPSWLFFSTRTSIAPLLLIAAPLMALGTYRIIQRALPQTATLVIGAALIIPLSGASFGQPHFMTDAAAVLPVLALLCGYGAVQLGALVSRRPLEDREVAGAFE